jgi:hypothetical protein
MKTTRLLLGCSMLLALYGTIVMAQTPIWVVDPSAMETTLVKPPPPAPSINVIGIEPFSAEAGYKSLVGYYRWSYFQMTGEWITPEEAGVQVDLQLATQISPPDTTIGTDPTIFDGPVFNLTEPSR